MQNPQRPALSLPLMLATLAACGLQLGFALQADERELFALFRDDAFYYFVIASHIVNDGFSSFDGVLATNGYHPLWLLLTLPLVWCFGLSNTLLLAVMGMSAIILLATAWLLQRCIQTLTGEPDDSPVLVAACLFAMLLALQIGFIGMESTLAVPLLLLTIWRLQSALAKPPTTQDALLLGFVLAMLCLARIDAALLAVIAGAVILWQGRHTPSRTAQTLAMMALGALPFLIYLLFNKWHYGHWLTTSALAKQIEPFWGFNTRALKLLISIPVLPFVIASVTSVIALRTISCWPNRAAHQAMFTSVLFASVFFALVLFHSSWMIWRWYLYPLVPAVAIGSWWCLRHMAMPMKPLVILLALALPASIAMNAVKSRHGAEAGIYDSAQQIAEFERDHPGRYAMGDAAGMPGFLMQNPPLQLEGLVADAVFIDQIRQQRELHSVLKEYGVDYLIDRGPSREQGGCQPVIIPNTRQAGDAPKLSGVFCEPAIVLADNLRIYSLHFTGTNP